MLKIVAIGGGEIGRPGCPVETEEIDEQIIRLTGKSKPKVLFIPTASGDSEAYCQAFEEHFGSRLGCSTDVLRLVGPSRADDYEAASKILESDAVYVGGGNTWRMMRIWCSHGVDEALREAARRGIVMSGLSAGAICWFRFGNSDSRRFKNPEAPLIRVSGLNLIPATLCPHHDVEVDRQADLVEMMRRTPGVAIALDNCCAVEIQGDTYRILTSRERAHASKVYWRNGVLCEQLLKQDGEPRSLKNLLSRS